MAPEPSTTALIIPALNEEAVLGQTLQRIPAALYRVVIVADNGSTDRTAEIARSHGALVTSEPERGYGATCLKALAALPAEIQTVVFMQSDLSEDPAEAKHLLAPILDGRADMVLGSRTLGHAERGALYTHQVFGNWLATSLIRVFYAYRYTDLGPYRAIRRDALERLRMQHRNYGWTIEMQVRALEEGLRIVEVPISYKIRAAGENKVSGNLRASIEAGAKIIWTVLRLWIRRRFGPQRRTVSTPEIQ
jgi:glycosyltransferase involved in cell wall biosynthesis